MEKHETLELLAAVRDGALSPEEALQRLQQQPFEDLGYAKVDHHRGIRQGVGEVIYGAGKTAEQIDGILRSLMDKGAKNILITRLDEEKAAFLAPQFPMEYHAVARLAIVNRDESRTGKGLVTVVSAGTSDMYAAEEAALTAECLGSRVVRIYDAGVAGLHRLLAHMDELTAARCVVAVAGMEGALASVVGGLVSCPVIAVPTSVGYGASFDGLAALLAMMNSCASGVSVVNIDNGFGGGYIAHRINMTEGIG
ncbi:MAG: nickel pincer cofactor biosynthesis protein LarB [Oscillospiraceae bacterium]|nr:nickel pincer cofactor biosynthesis protein LarB [Oscillospiraceae bacterium]